MPLVTNMPHWPGSPGLTTSWHQRQEAGDLANATKLEMDVHCGTHIDAPKHFIPSGAAVEAVGLDTLVGPAWVADARGAASIDRDFLDEVDPPTDVERLLLRTDNSSDE